ncbi:MAG: glycosyltransferase family 39 protein [Abditibacteriales bacterium]|nr:glycosyltransferase family 39 protein [Abditibacteriales bacterium]
MTSATFLLVTAALLLARLAIALNFDLFPDEALYAWLAERALLSFTPHPPGIPLLVRAGTFLLGKTELGVRVFPMLLTTLMPVPLYLLARDIGGRRVALWSVIAAAAVPSYFAFGVVTTPDGTQLFFWTLALYFTFKALETWRLSWWALAGMTVGIGLYIKYIIVLYYPSLLLCLLLSPTWRAHLRSRGPYLSLAVAFLVFAPAAMGHEYATHFSATRYHLSERQTLQPPSVSGIVIYQLLHAGYLSPLLYCGLLAAMVWAGINGVRKKDDRLLFLFCFSAVMFVFFLLIAAVTKRVLNREHWDAPAYVAALVAAVMMQTASPQRKGRRVYAGLALALGFVTSAVYVFEGATGLGSRLMGSRPPFAKLLGWRAMAAEVDKLMPGDALFLGETFPCALAYAFYGRQTKRVYTLDREYSAKYGLVGVLNSIDASQGLAHERGRDAIYVAEVNSPSHGSLPNPLITRTRALRQAFAAVEQVRPIPVRRYRREVKWFYVLRCRNLRTTLPLSP